MAHYYISNSSSDIAEWWNKGNCYFRVRMYGTLFRDAKVLSKLRSCIRLSDEGNIKTAVPHCEDVEDALVLRSVQPIT